MTSSSQAKYPILAYSNLLLGRFHVLSESSNRRALSFACTNQIAPYRHVILSIVGLHGEPFVACAMVFCLEKESRTISSAAFDAKNNCYK